MASSNYEFPSQRGQNTLGVLLTGAAVLTFGSCGVDGVEKEGRKEDIYSLSGNQTLPIYCARAQTTHPAVVAAVGLLSPCL